MADASTPAPRVDLFAEQVAHPTDPGHWMRTGRTIRVTYAPGSQAVLAIDVQAAPDGPWEPFTPPYTPAAGAAS
ncbi:hypothetical protein ACLBX9_15915 [Methylobacterium sp. A49B]